MGRKLFRGLAFLCAGMLLAGMPAAADEPPDRVITAPKDEVIYVNLGNDGAVREAYAVSSFEVGQTGMLVDYGSYRSVQNLTSTEEIHNSNGRISVPVRQAGRFYYQGTMEPTEMPWLISIRYWMDGRSLPAEELAGKSGAFRMEIGLRKNPKAAPGFFENYTLQATATLDAKKCGNILAEGATAANAGSSKVLTFTVMPGTEKKLAIQADVTDFSLAGLQINGIPLNMEIELPDTSSFTDKIGELQTGVEKLDDGAADLWGGVEGLYDGADSLKEGADDLCDGISSLYDGAAELDAGALEFVEAAGQLEAGSGQLYDGSLQYKRGFQKLERSGPDITGGSTQLKDGLEQLAQGVDAAVPDAASLQPLKELKEGSAQMKEGLEGLSQLASQVYQNGADTALTDRMPSLMSRAQTDPELAALLYAYQTKTGMAKALSDHLNGVSQSYAKIDGGVNQLADSVEKSSAMTGQLARTVRGISGEFGRFDKGVHEYVGGVYELYMGYAEIHSGIKELDGGTSKFLDGTVTFSHGVGELYTGAEELRDGAETLRTGTGELREGIGKLRDGTGTLKEGTGEFREKTAGMDQDITDEIDRAVRSFQRKDFHPTSFLSDKNTNVHSVQFVMKTPGITEPEKVAAVRAEEPERTFWQKLLKLFGLYREEEPEA